jgi:hypothetical protein
MKIDGNRPAHDTSATDGARRTGKDAGVQQGSGVAPSAAAGDRVELSGDAALRAAALKAANAAPAIRTASSIRATPIMSAIRRMSRRVGTACSIPTLRRRRWSAPRPPP